MISPHGSWIPDPTKNAVRDPKVMSTGLHGEGLTQIPVAGKGAAENGRTRVARNAKTGMQRMSPHTLALALVIATPFALFMIISIYKSGMWLPALVVALIFVIRHRRRSASRLGRIDRRIRLPLDRHTGD